MITCELVPDKSICLLSTSVLSEIDTHKSHYVRVPENHIVIDFDIKDETGKGGCGIHLPYIYTGKLQYLAK